MSFWCLLMLLLSGHSVVSNSLDMSIFPKLAKTAPDLRQHSVITICTVYHSISLSRVKLNMGNFLIVWLGGTLAWLNPNTSYWDLELALLDGDEQNWSHNQLIPVAHPAWGRYDLQPMNDPILLWIERAIITIHECQVLCSPVRGECFSWALSFAGCTPGNGKSVKWLVSTQSPS